jgi:AcrR family transcriptional regulator
MPQVPKEKVREAIVAAAARVFARDGYDKAAVATIAAEAGISAGNVYRYFPGKQELFAAAVPDAIAARLRQLIDRRVEALAGARDVAALPPDAPYHLASEELFRFTFAHRPQVVVLLARGAGTPHAAFADDLASRLVELALAHGRRVVVGLRATAALRATLRTIYRHYVAALAAALAANDTEPRLAEALRLLSAYHLAGVKALLEASVEAPRSPR